MNRDDLTDPQKGLVRHAEAAGFEVFTYTATEDYETADGDHLEASNTIIAGTRDVDLPGALRAFHARWWHSGPEVLVRRVGESVRMVLYSGLVTEVRTGTRPISPTDLLERYLDATSLDRGTATKAEVAAERAAKAELRAAARAKAEVDRANRALSAVRRKVG